MIEATFDRLTLALLPGVSSRVGRDLLARGPLRAALDHPDDHGDLLPVSAREELRSGRARLRAEDEDRRATARGIRIVGADEPEYPLWLRRTYDPPLVLWARGVLVTGEGERAVAIVGSRAASAHGLAFVRALAQDLARAGITIVSGLARGIDTAAHQGALDVRGRTVAVLGSGLDRPYPDENRGLVPAIAREGAVVSEFPLGTPAWRSNFPRRNRVIAGWGRAVVIAEASEKSGALHTARSALEEGREVMAVPGHPSDPRAAGTNALLRDGAALVRHAADVADEIGLELPPPPVAPGDDVLSALRRDSPSSLEEIASRCRRAVPELLARLTELELEAQVRRLPGSLFVRS